ncbi:MULTISPECIES: hypothetical protein [unclassified Enterococcus]|uniref:hypothetical protein n=1 Tax=unclassified Enterococcus TaxID=2608891 RepID=UPI001CE1B531|nr:MULTISPECIES: hypothetical protein [unclassified Enterococcus]MCA5014129.1 hypothetical protein [Enterococcus sp. S23]MCA5017651.1 hypothetical protein [Enterococcus sp. S22(2020)]
MEEFDKINIDIRRHEEDRRNYEIDILNAKNRLEHLYNARAKQQQSQNAFHEMQERRKRQCQGVFGISAHMRFSNSHATRIMDILDGNKARHTEQALNEGFQKVIMEIETEEQKIAMTRQLIINCDNTIDKLYYQRSQSL